MNKVSARWGRTLLLFALLLSVWLLWSGMFKPLLLGFGVFSCLLTCYISRRMDYFDSEVLTLSFNLRLIGYLGWLTKEVVHSSFEVTRVVLHPGLPTSPRVIEIDATALDAVDQVLLGNSITLTPGTVALDVHRGIIKVHCLTREGAETLMSGEMLQRVATVRGGRRCTTSLP